MKKNVLQDFFFQFFCYGSCKLALLLQIQNVGISYNQFNRHWTGALLRQSKNFPYQILLLTCQKGFGIKAKKPIQK